MSLFLHKTDYFSNNSPTHTTIQMATQVKSMKIQFLKITDNSSDEIMEYSSMMKLKSVLF